MSWVGRCIREVFAELLPAALSRGVEGLRALLIAYRLAYGPSMISAVLDISRSRYRSGYCATIDELYAKLSKLVEMYGVEAVKRAFAEARLSELSAACPYHVPRCFDRWLDDPRRSDIMGVDYGVEELVKGVLTRDVEAEAKRLFWQAIETRCDKDRLVGLARSLFEELYSRLVRGGERGGREALQAQG